MLAPPPLLADTQGGLGAASAHHGDLGGGARLCRWLLAQHRSFPAGTNLLEKRLLVCDSVPKPGTLQAGTLGWNPSLKP
eukprot:3899669-Rhodomonas_salina.1